MSSDVVGGKFVGIGFVECVRKREREGGREMGLK